MTITQVQMTRPATRSAALAAEVRAEAARFGLNQGALARLLGRSQQTISDRFTGRVPWTVDETERLEEVFGLEPGDLLLRAVAATRDQRVRASTSYQRPGHGSERARWELAA